VEEGEDGGREAEEAKSAEGAEDTEARFKGDALAFGLASVDAGAVSVHNVTAKCRSFDFAPSALRSG
jgi:hypothetical protein